MYEMYRGKSFFHLAGLGNYVNTNSLKLASQIKTRGNATNGDISSR